MLGRYLTLILGISVSNDPRQSLLEILHNHPEGHLDPNIRAEFGHLLEEYAHQEEGGNRKDVLFTIGSSVYGIDVPLPEAIVDDSEPQQQKVEIVEFAFMKSFMKDVFLSYGVRGDRADICADVLIEADRRGIDSHGLGRLKPIYCDRMEQGILHPSPPIDIVKETDTTAYRWEPWTGALHWTLLYEDGDRQGQETRNRFRGCKKVYSLWHRRLLCHHGYRPWLHGWTGTNARPSIAPTFGVEPMLGTNPLTFGIPTDEPFPFVIDCASSINQRGKIEQYARDGLETPKGVVIDDKGIERIDSEGILRDMVLGKCALNPMGGAGDKTAGYKGYSWATVVELLSTAFQSGPFGEKVCGIDRKTGKKIPMPLGHYFLAIDIEAICPLDIFKKNAGDLLRALRASKKSPVGPGRIWTAGEPEYEARLKCDAQGGMIVKPSLQKQMMELRDARPGLKEKYPKFQWED